jgi:hypothetical protein
MVSELEVLNLNPDRHDLFKKIKKIAAYSYSRLHSKESCTRGEVLNYKLIITLSLSA